MDGEPCVVSRRNHRGCYRAQRQGEAYLFAWAQLPDPDKIFNAGLGGNQWRAIDFFEGDKVSDRALKNLVCDAVVYNQIKAKKKAAVGSRAKVQKSKE